MACLQVVTTFLVMYTSFLGGGIDYVAKDVLYPLPFCVKEHKVICEAFPYSAAGNVHTPPYTVRCYAVKDGEFFKTPTRITLWEGQGPVPHPEM